MLTSKVAACRDDRHTSHHLCSWMTTAHGGLIMPAFRPQVENNPTWASEHDSHVQAAYAISAHVGVCMCTCMYVMYQLAGF